MIAKDHDKLISFWTRHIENKRAASQDRSAYCRQHNLKPHQMAYWERRLSSLKTKKREQAQRLPKGDFVKAIVQSQAGSSSRPASVNGPQTFRIILGADLAIELSHSADPIWLAALINAMRGVSR